MSDCIRFQDKLHDWVDQELDLPTSEEIDLHVARCPQCADAAKGIRHMKQLIKAKAWQPEAPNNLKQGVQQMLALESSKPKSRWSGITILPLAATAALILVLLTPQFFNSPASSGTLDASVISDPVFNSHLRTLSGDDQPTALFQSHESASSYVSNLIDRAVVIPRFENFSIWGVSVLEVGQHEIPKVFYRGAGSHLSLFLVCMEHETSSGIHPLKHGVSFTVYCFPGVDFCCLLATSDHPSIHHGAISACHCAVKNCSSECPCK
ncbi:MAG: hypothetical protein CBC13_05400 [Planctomycetia bacterium TMED53]|nr:MAG: hypothetical protein CBC13_05400 [Planctomycetia bacterium TMED53]